MSIFIFPSVRPYVKPSTILKFEARNKKCVDNISLYLTESRSGCKEVNKLKTTWVTKSTCQSRVVHEEGRRVNTKRSLSQRKVVKSTLPGCRVNNCYKVHIFVSPSQPKKGGKSTISLIIIIINHHYHHPSSLSPSIIIIITIIIHHHHHHHDHHHHPSSSSSIIITIIIIIIIIIHHHHHHHPSSPSSSSIIIIIINHHHHHHHHHHRHRRQFPFLLL